MRIALIGFALLTIPFVAPASAGKLDYLVELGNAVAIPLGGDTYKQLVDPSYKASLRFALGIPVVKGLRLGPAVQLDGTAIKRTTPRSCRCASTRASAVFASSSVQTRATAWSHDSISGSASPSASTT